ncbi:MAG: ribonuclease Z [Asgard group archaeon]|nr:ribonuclease Z [Asgard group archaeon]
MSDKMIITFLGTSSAPPQADRSQSSMSLKYRRHNLLFDVGEGTQFQMVKNKISMKNLTILLTHLHSDHTLGLIGLLTTRDFYSISSPVTIIGPPWTSSFVFLQLLAYRLEPDYEIKIIETEGGIVTSNDDFYIESFKVSHSENSFGYKIETHKPLGVFNVEKAEEKEIQKGKLWNRIQNGFPIEIDGKIIYPSEIMDDSQAKQFKVVITGDTNICQSVINKASEADLLIHDATYPHTEERRAKKYLHSTCVDAARVAKFSNVKKLVMTHISTLHENLNESLESTQKIFPNSVFAEDGLRIILDPKDY